MLAIIYTSSQPKSCITHLQWINGTNLTTNPLLYCLAASPHCRNRGEGKSKPECALMGRADPPESAGAASRTVWKGTCWCCWQCPYLYLVETPSAGILTQAVSCVARKPRAYEKKMLLCLPAATFRIAALRDGKGQSIPRLCPLRAENLTGVGWEGP